tara:strand:+ start:23 stop:433 length:411 start_codon:yes stop_codon:yes gene_type:complete
MILFHAENNFRIKAPQALKVWITNSVLKEEKTIGDINIIFCDDTFLLIKNKKYLNHSSLTDILTFDFSTKKSLSGDIFISTERVKENATKYNVPFNNELNRVIIHGVLHLLGYKDKTEKEKKIMRKKEDFYLSLQT